MSFGSRFKEVYIRLVESEPKFVCTVRYGGLPGKSTEFPLKTSPEVTLAPEQEAVPILRTRNRVRASSQTATGEQ